MGVNWNILELVEVHREILEFFKVHVGYSRVPGVHGDIL